MPYLMSSDGPNWYYETEGEGPAILFIHGWGVNLRVWRQQCKYFSRFYKTIAVDLPGHGRTSWQKMGLEAMARGCREILDQENVGVCHLIGSSMGGLVLLKICQLFPERVCSLVMAGSLPKFFKNEEYPFGLDKRQIDKMAGQIKTNYPSMIHVFFRSLFTIQERQTRRFKWIHTFRKTDTIPSQTALLELLEMLTQEDLRDVLLSLKSPVQFMNGTQDYICPKEAYLFWQQKIPGAKFEWFESCGHFPFLSYPHEFNRRLAAFLSQAA